jgi:hypothetical protein
MKYQTEFRSRVSDALGVFNCRCRRGRHANGGTRKECTSASESATECEKAGTVRLSAGKWRGRRGGGFFSFSRSSRRNDILFRHRSLHRHLFVASLPLPCRLSREPWPEASKSRIIRAPSPCPKSSTRSMHLISTITSTMESHAFAPSVPPLPLVDAHLIPYSLLHLSMSKPQIRRFV